MLNMNWILLLCPNAWCILARLLALIYAAHFTFHILAACLPFPRIYCSPHLYVYVWNDQPTLRSSRAVAWKFTALWSNIYNFIMRSVSSMCNNHFNIILFLPALFFIHFICLYSHRIYMGLLLYWTMCNMRVCWPVCRVQRLSCATHQSYGIVFDERHVWPGWCILLVTFNLRMSM